MQVLKSVTYALSLQYDQVHIFLHILAYSSILSAYLWLNLLISSLTYGTLRS